MIAVDGGRATELWLVVVQTLESVSCVLGGREGVLIFRLRPRRRDNIGPLLYGLQRTLPSSFTLARNPGETAYPSLSGVECRRQNNDANSRSAHHDDGQTRTEGKIEVEENTSRKTAVRCAPPTSHIH